MPGSGRGRALVAGQGAGQPDDHLDRLVLGQQPRQPPSGRLGGHGFDRVGQGAVRVAGGDADPGFAPVERHPDAAPEPGLVLHSLGRPLVELITHSLVELVETFRGFDKLNRRCLSLDRLNR